MVVKSQPEQHEDIVFVSCGSHRFGPQTPGTHDYFAFMREPAAFRTPQTDSREMLHLEWMASEKVKGESYQLP